MISTTVTAIIACYNQAGFIEQALDSVRDQSLRPSQLIVTDDASSDGSADCIERWLAANWSSAEFIRHGVNTGLPRVLNEAVALADGELLVIMAADDWMQPDRLERQSAAFAAAPAQVGLIYSDMNVVDEAGRATGERFYRDIPHPVEGDCFTALLESSVPATPSVMMRRAALVEAGPYDESLPFEDWDMWLRLARVVRFGYLPAPLVNYRRIDSSLSRSDSFQAAWGEASIHVLRKHVGVSREGDRLIGARVARTAQKLYREGRDPKVTASDLWFAMRLRPSARGLVALLLASARVPGPAIDRSRARLASLVPLSGRTSPMQDHEGTPR